MQRSASERVRTQLHARTPPCATKPPSHHSPPWIHAPLQWGDTAGMEAAVPTSSWREKLGDGGCPVAPLTADVEVVLGHDAAHGAGGRADIGAAVALVKEGEDEDAVRAQLQGCITALLLPQELLGAVERDGGEAPPPSPVPWEG